MGLDRVARALPEGAGRVRRGAAGPTRGRGRQATPGRGMTPFDDHRPGIFKRLLVGAALVIFAAAGATAVAAFREVDRVVNALKLQPQLKLGSDLAQSDPGNPQTLLILGSDHRPKNNTENAAGARSDTIILVRL